jgi:PncC family amidohydrolase
MTTKDRPEREIAQLLRELRLTIATAESATGGLVANLVTDVPGSSDYFKGSVVAYANEIKEGVLGVSGKTLAEYGAVSPETAGEMAQGVRRLMNVDIGLSDTGIAGPSRATSEKPVGLFYIGLSSQQKTAVEEHFFHEDRLENKRACAEAALQMLKNYLLELKG